MGSRQVRAALDRFDKEGEIKRCDRCWEVGRPLHPKLVRLGLAFPGDWERWRCWNCRNYLLINH